MIQLHATCVLVSGVGVLIRGPSGNGKSDLALRLIDEGAELVADDYCDIAIENGKLMAAAPPTLAGKLEVRGLGITQQAFCAKVAVGLVVDLCATQEIERLPEGTTTVIANVTLPCIKIDAFTASASAKVRLALRWMA